MSNSGAVVKVIHFFDLHPLNKKDPFFNATRDNSHEGVTSFSKPMALRDESRDYYLSHRKYCMDTVMKLERQIAISIHKEK